MSVEAGARLREAREQKGLSVADVSARLKVPLRYIEALEAGDLAALPEPAFVRGYVRAYARLVDIDPAALAALCQPVEVRAPRPQVGIAGMPGTVMKPRRRAGGGKPATGLRRHHYISAGLLLLAAAGSVTWIARDPAPVPGQPAVLLPDAAPQEKDVLPGATVEVALPLPPGSEAPVTAPADTSSVPAGATPANVVPPSAVPVTAPASATAPPAAPAAPAAPATPAVPQEGLYVRFTGDCWIEVRDADNRVIHHSSGVAGTDLRLNGREPLAVTLGNAGRADLWWNGEPVRVDNFSRAGVARVNVGRIAR